jgi:hypothetical protein
MSPLSLAAVKLNGLEFIIIIAVAILGLLAAYMVHCGLKYFYLGYARRFCRNNGLKLVHWE